MPTQNGSHGCRSTWVRCSARCRLACSWLVALLCRALSLFTSISCNAKACALVSQVAAGCCSAGSKAVCFGFQCHRLSTGKCSRLASNPKVFNLRVSRFILFLIILVLLLGLHNCMDRKFWKGSSVILGYLYRVIVRKRLKTTDLTRNLFSMWTPAFSLGVWEMRSLHKRDTGLALGLLARQSRRCEFFLVPFFNHHILQKYVSILNVGISTA